MTLLFFFCLLMSCPVQAQAPVLVDRKTEIEKLMMKIASVKLFQYVAKNLEMTVAELADYPVIFPVKRDSYANYTASPYGKRLHPVLKVMKNHTGIDIAEAKARPVYATGNGVVGSVGWKSGYGNFVEVRHTAGFTSFYAHLDKIVVAAGDSVVMGEHIACIGNTGLATGSHLHYEVRKNGKCLNPEGWCWALVDYKCTK